MSDEARIFSRYNWSCKQAIEDTSPADLYSSSAALQFVTSCKSKLWATWLMLALQPVHPYQPTPWATQTSGMQRLTSPLYLSGYFCAVCLSSVPRSLINILFQILWTSGIWLACLLRQLYYFRLVREGWRLKLPSFGKTQSKLSSLLLHQFTQQLGLQSAGAFQQVSNFHAQIQPHWYHLPITITAKHYICTLSTGRVIRKKVTSAPITQN